MPSSHLEKAEFLWNNLVCRLKLENDILHIKCLKKLNSFNPRPLLSYDKQIPLLHIVSVECGTGLWKADNEKRLVQLNLMNLFQARVSSCFDVTIKCLVKMKNHWKLHSFTLKASDEKYTKGWQDLLQIELNEKIKKSGITRPKKLLVFVNPYGGRKKAESVYKNVAEPLFKLAGIDCSVEITQHRNYARDMLQSLDFSGYDGIIAVGGDGMANEIINGVLFAQQKQSNIPLDSDPKSILIQPINYAKAKVRIGLIPAGSTNCLSYVSQGIDDAETAVLQIICGENHPLDMCSIHEDNGKFVRFSFSMTSYGYFGQVLQKSENLRKLGPSRYDIAGINAFTQAKSYNSKVAYLPSSPESPIDVSKVLSKCRYPCATCTDVVDVSPRASIDDKSAPTFIEGNSSDSFIHQNGKQKLSVESTVSANDLLEETFSFNNKWKISEGKFLMVNSALTSCTCSKCPEGLSPSAHLSDGNIDLILLRTSSRSDLLKYLVSHIGKANRFDFPFVEVHRVKGFHHRAIVKPCFSDQINGNNLLMDKDLSSASTASNLTTGCWNSDGEVIENPNISLWVHKGLISLYARGVE